MNDSVEDQGLNTVRNNTDVVFCFQILAVMFKSQKFMVTRAEN